MAKFLSDRQQSLKVGISSYTESNTVLQTIGKVGIGTTNAGGRSLYVIGDAEVSGVVTARSISIGATQVISSSRQLQNISSLDATTTATIEDAIKNAPNTFTDLNVTGISTLGVTSTTNLTSQQLNVSGISTLGITTVTNLTAQQINVSGVSTLTTLNTTNIVGTALSVASGIATIGTLNATNIVGTALSVASGISTLGTVNFTTATGSNIVGTALSVASGISTLGVTTVTNLTAQQINVSGISTLGTVNATNIVGTALSVASGIATIGTVNFTTATGSNIVGTALSVASGISTLGVTTVTNLTAQQINVSGISTLGTLNATNIVGTALSVASGISTLGTVNFTTATGSNIVGTALSVASGIATIGTVNATNIVGTALSVASGIATIGTVNATNIVGTALSVASGISTLGITIVTNLTAQRLNVSGVTTLGVVTSGNIFSSGIITASQFSTGASGSAINITSNTISGPSELTIDPSAVGDNTGAVRIKGDLYVDGTQFIVNSSTIDLADLRVGIATTVGTNLLLDGGGIGIGSANIAKTITWNNSVSALTSSEDWNLVSGKQYEINGTSVLTSTTLGSGVINSSLTSVGALGQLKVSGISTLGVTTATNLTAQNLYISGIATIGVTSVTDLTAKQLNVSGVSTFTQISVNGSTGANQYVLSSTGTGLSWQPVTAIGAISAISISDDTATTTPQFLLFTNTSSGSVTSEKVSSTKLTYVASSGSLGVGTTNPSQPLDVNGNVRIRGGIYDSANSSGSSNNVLTSNGSGGWSWQPVSAVGGSNINISNDTTNASRFLVFTNVSSGSTATEYVSTSELVFNPSSGNLGIGSTIPTSKLTITGNISVSGVSTSGGFNATTGNDYKINGTSVLTSTTLGSNVVNSSLTSVGTLGQLNVSGVSTLGTLNATNIVGTALSVATGISTLGVTTTTNLTTQRLNVSGVSTLGTIQISSGIVTATSGVVTYYGDGSKLTGVSGGVIISTDTTNQNQLIPYVVSTGSTTGLGVTVGLVFNPSSGSLGIATASPTSKLHVEGDALIVGVVTVTDINSTSDINLKDNIHTVENSIDIVNHLRGVKFDWKKDLKSSYGVIAQEVEKVLPELVCGENPKTVNYNGLIGVLIEAVKELSAEVEELKAQINK